MSKHTPGPWVVKEWEHLDVDGSMAACGYHVVATRGKHDIVISASTIEDEDESDLHLIAAAPELLEACQLLVADYEGLNSAIGDDWYRKAKAAIAKAKGGAS